MLFMDGMYIQNMQKESKESHSGIAAIFSAYLTSWSVSKSATDQNASGNDS